MAERIRGMHHIGITVPNIEEGIKFFVDVLGAIPVFRTGAFDVDNAFMKNKLGAAPQSRIQDLVFLRLGNGTSVELFEYKGDDVDAGFKRNSQIGGTHICFEVDDVNVTAKNLKKMGIELLEGPNLVDAGPLEGFNWIYFMTPWGQTLEVASFDKLGYERDTPHRLWRS